jgi:tetratricopeptide (TPR) repeat protein
MQKTSPMISAPTDFHQTFDAALEQSRMLLQARDWGQAAAAFRSLLPTPEKQAQALSGLGAALAGAGDLDRAAQAYEDALRLMPSMATARRDLAYAYAGLERWAAAIDHFQKLRPAIDDNGLSSYYLVLGNYCINFLKNTEGKTRKLEEKQLHAHEVITFTIKKIIACEYVIVEALCNLLTMQISQTDPYAADVFIIWAMSRQSTGDAAGAMECLRRLCGRPATGREISLFGQVAGQAAWSDEAKAAFFRTYRTAAGDNPTHLTTAAAGLSHIGAWDEAVEALQRAVEIAPESDADADFALARTLARCGRIDESISAYEKLIRRRPDFWLAYYDAAQLYRLTGRHDEADACERKCAELPRPDGDSGGFHEFGQAGLVDMSQAAFTDAKDSKDQRLKWLRTANVRYFPTGFEQGNINKLIDLHFLQEGRRPEKPIFTKDAKLVTFGSCFATYLRRALEAQGKTSETMQISEELNNSWALRYYLDWCFTGDESSISYWYEAADRRHAPSHPYEEYRRMLQNADGFVLTFGLSEIWRDKSTGNVFWKGVPENLFDENRHEVILSSVADNIDNMRHIYNLFRTHCGGKPVVFTVSPVPLKATFRGVPCIEADCASKSVLRAAVEGLMQEKPADLYYWPSYEIVRWLGAHLAASTYGLGRVGGNGVRHVNHGVIDAIVSSFIRSHFEQ